ncbi:unnamed protein product [Echinostoma caproni]|uniref:Transposase n=1 Tax=Echinostoma caproni TaxID=27848 RepID=A0A183B7J8_9TREM|nr:unnamed protein product [Echinostoma caproni]
MKSSGGAGDIDPQELRGYRRLNGYQLFVMVNKKKHESALTTNVGDDAVDPVDTQRDLHRKWQAIWFTLPEKTRKEWKTKARRLMKQTGQMHHSGSQSSHGGRRSGWSKDRFKAEIRKIENQLARSDSVSTTLSEYAAYFQLLSDSFATAARNLNTYDGFTFYGPWSLHCNRRNNRISTRPIELFTKIICPAINSFFIVDALPSFIANVLTDRYSTTSCALYHGNSLTIP